jgi:hypothetical protein
MAAAGANEGRQKACPSCGSTRVARILYGEPMGSASLEADLEAGRVVLGGCLVADDSPRYRCADCGNGSMTLAMEEGSDEPTPGHYVAMVLPSGPLAEPRVVGRLVLTGDAASKRPRPEPALLLETACDELARKQARVRYLLTPAGFLRPKLAPGRVRSRGWKTDPEDFQTLIDVAASELSRFLAGPLLAKLHAVADHLAIGVDLYAPDNHGRPYGETALLVRTRDGKVEGWTGKSFPTSQQQGHLIRNGEVANHLMTVGDDRVAILVCHDLVAFGRRSEKNSRGTRASVGRALEDALSGGPTVVLHLPHTTDRMTTWGPAWDRLLIRHGSAATAWASAIKYRTSGDARPDKPLRHGLLGASSSGPDSVLDIVLGDYVAL